MGQASNLVFGIKNSSTHTMHEHPWENLSVEHELGNPYRPWIEQIWKHNFKVSLPCGVLFQTFPPHCINILSHLSPYFPFLLPRPYSQLFSFHSFIFIHTTIYMSPSSFLHSLCWKLSNVGRTTCPVKICSFPPSCYIVRWRKKGMCFHRSVWLTVVAGSNH